ncbi:cytidylyltransferase domain-containing protein [Candidatus Margulisiibacteriota bacterium]
MNKKEKKAIVIQARRGSKRLPNKVLADISGKPLLSYVIERVEMSQKIDEIILATTTNREDDVLEDLFNDQNIVVFRGEDEDVLKRFVRLAEERKIDVVVRITADCPLIDYQIVDLVLQLYENEKADYIYIDGYPRGLADVELLSYKALKQSELETDKTQNCYREHVVTYILDHPEKFKLKITSAPLKFCREKYRFCVDEMSDLKLVRMIYEHFLPRHDFNLEEIIAYVDKNPELAKINQNVKQKTA